MSPTTDIDKYISDYLHGSSAVIILLTVSIIIFYKWLQPKPLLGFPHNPIRGIFGDVPGMMRMFRNGDKNVHDYYAHQVATHGPISQMFVGKRTIIVLADQVEAERVLLKSKIVDIPLYLSQVFAQFAPKASNAVFSNDLWKRNRRVYKPNLRQQHQMAIRVSSIADSLVNLWNMKRANGIFSAGVDVELAVMDSLAYISLGSSFHCVEKALSSLSENNPPAEQLANSKSSVQGQPMHEAVNQLLVHLSFGPMMPFPSITYPLYLRLSSTWHKSRELLSSFVSERVAVARKRAKLAPELRTDEDCALDLLVQQGDCDGSEETKAMRESEWFDEMMVFFLSGQTPPASVLSWLVKYLAQDIDIQRRLHTEICEEFGPSSVDFTALDDPKRMPILHAVVAETHRCSMSAGIIVRQLLADEVIMGRHTPQGSELLIPTGLFGMKESDWGPDVREWHPERWLRPDGTFNNNAGPGGNPFGMGHRMCPGRKITTILLHNFVAALSRAFVFKPVAAEHDSFLADVAMTRRPKQCYVSLEPWDQE